jgi:hypothetical protein
LEVSVTILSLIIKLCDIRKKLRWQIRCAYIDGQGDAVFRIIFYDALQNSQKGEISFYQNTEQILNFRFAGYNGDKPETLIDLLLDLINHEKSFVEAL